MFINNYKLTARNMTYAYLILMRDYSDFLSDEQCMYAAGIVQCAAVLLRPDAYIDDSYFDLASAWSAADECGLDIYHRKLYSGSWFEREALTSQRWFANYVMNVACIFFYETMSPRIKYTLIVDSVVSKKKLIHKNVKKVLDKGIDTKSNYYRVAFSWVNAIMNKPELYSWKQHILSHTVTDI